MASSLETSEFENHTQTYFSNENVTLDISLSTRETTLMEGNITMETGTYV
jgi:hypothetical protein